MDSLWERVKRLAGQYAERGVVPPEEEAADQIRRLTRSEFMPEPPPQALAFYVREMRIMAAEQIADAFNAEPSLLEDQG